MPSAEPGPVHPVTVARKGWRVLRERWDVLLVISAGGVAGSLGRWAAGVAFPHRDGGFPWATAAVNVAGCLAIGVLMTVVEVIRPSRYLRPFLGTGVLGGFTTFSAYMLDTRALVVAGRPAVAGAYLFGSLGAGLTAVWVGVVLTRMVLVRAVLIRPGTIRPGTIRPGAIRPTGMPGRGAAPAREPEGRA